MDAWRAKAENEDPVVVATGSEAEEQEVRSFRASTGNKRQITLVRFTEDGDESLLCESKYGPEERKAKITSLGDSAPKS